MKFLALFAACLFLSLNAQAKRVSAPNVQKCIKDYKFCILVSKASQRLFITYRAKGLAPMPVGVRNAYDGVKISTARGGKHTPTGTFTIGEVAGRWRTSGRYKGAALYFALQIQGNIFIHATSVSNYIDLGSGASAGCIRTTLDVADFLNEMTRDIGNQQGGVLRDTSNIRVVVTDEVINLRNIL